MAVAHADHILQLQENLTTEEMPPSWVWPFSKELDEWVTRALNDRKKDSPSPSSGDDDDFGPENELLKR